MTPALVRLAQTLLQALTHGELLAGNMYSPEHLKARRPKWIHSLPFGPPGLPYSVLHQVNSRELETGERHAPDLLASLPNSIIMESCLLNILKSFHICALSSPVTNTQD